MGQTSALNMSNMHACQSANSMRIVFWWVRNKK